MPRDDLRRLVRSEAPVGPPEAASLYFDVSVLPEAPGAEDLAAPPSAPGPDGNPEAASPGPGIATTAVRRGERPRMPAAAPQRAPRRAGSARGPGPRTAAVGPQGRGAPVWPEAVPQAVVDDGEELVVAAVYQSQESEQELHREAFRRGGVAAKSLVVRETVEAYLDWLDELAQGDPARYRAVLGTIRSDDGRGTARPVRQYRIRRSTRDRLMQLAADERVSASATMRTALESRFGVAP